MSDSPTCRRVHASSQRGFTLVELISSIAVLGVLAVVSSRLVFAAGDQYVSAVTQAEVSGSLSAAMEFATTQARSIPVRASSSPSAPAITSITPNSIAWTDGNGVSRSLSLVSSQLQYAESTSTSVLATSVTGFGVRAFDSTNTALAATLSGSAVDAVRRVEFTITASRQGVSDTLRSKVFIRSMGVGS